MRLLLALSLFIFLIPFSSSILPETSPYGLFVEDPSIDYGGNYSINVNHSITADTWITNLGNLDNANATQFENEGGTLNLLPGWLTTFGNTVWCALTGCTMTGDLIVEGSINSSDWDNLTDLTDTFYIRNNTQGWNIIINSTDVSQFGGLTTKGTITGNTFILRTAGEADASFFHSGTFPTWDAGYGDISLGTVDYPITTINYLGGTGVEFGRYPASLQTVTINGDLITTNTIEGEQITSTDDMEFNGMIAGKGTNVDEEIAFYNGAVKQGNLVYRGSLSAANRYFGFNNDAAAGGMRFYNKEGDIRFYQQNTNAFFKIKFLTRNLAGTGNVERMTISNKVDIAIVEFLNSNVQISDGDFTIDSDNDKIFFGEAQDASINYNGSDMVFNQDVGEGDFVFDGGDVRIGTSNEKLKIGLNQELQIYVDAGEGLIVATTDNLKLIAPLTVSIGDYNPDVDYILQFNGESNDGTITWMEDESIFVFDGDLDVSNNFTGNQIHGGVFFHNDVEGNVTALTEDVWANFRGFTQDDNGQELNGFSYSDSNLTAQISGKFSCDFGSTFTGTANNKYHSTIGLNTVPQVNMEAHDRISTGTDILSASDGWFLDLVVGDNLSLMYMNENSGGDTTTLSAHIKCVMVGD